MPPPSPEVGIVPYAIKTGVFEDMWLQMKLNVIETKMDDGDASDGANENDGTKGENKENKKERKGKSDKNQKKKSLTKEKKPKKPKKPVNVAEKKTDSPKKDSPKKRKLAKQAKLQAKQLLRPEELLINIPGLPKDILDVKNIDHMVHGDYAPEVYQQAWKEWSADGAVVWTLGNGTAVYAAVQSELPVLGIAINEQQAAVAEFLTDSAIANALQIRSEGNKLYDAQLTRKVDRTFRGKGSDDESEEEPKPKKDKKDKDGKDKKKRKRDDEEDGESEDEEDGESEDEDDSDSE